MLSLRRKPGRKPGPPKVDPLREHRATADAYLQARGRATALPWDHPDYPQAAWERDACADDLAWLMSLGDAPRSLLHSRHHFLLVDGELVVRPLVERRGLKKGQTLGKAGRPVKISGEWRNAS